jgi:hypothetical protein
MAKAHRSINMSKKQGYPKVTKEALYKIHLHGLYFR